jgi:5'-phosphate synthase pdxT subunit
VVAKVGILALQGDVAEHERALRRCGAQPVRVRHRHDLEGVSGLILPGGESTTIGMLAVHFGLLDPLRAFIESGRPVWGTCGGLILLANDIGRAQPLFGGLEVRVKRNAFGRQVDSFEADVSIAELKGGPFRAVFIRAPVVEQCGSGVEVLATLETGEIVAVRQGPILGMSFHPELSDDDRLHAQFVESAT